MFHSLRQQQFGSIDLCALRPTLRCVNNHLPRLSLRRDGFCLCAADKERR